MVWSVYARLFVYYVFIFCWLPEMVNKDQYIFARQSVKLLTHWIADFVWSCALAGFSRSGVIHSNNSEFPLTVLNKVRHSERATSDRRCINWRPVARWTTFWHWALLDLVACRTQSSYWREHSCQNLWTCRHVNEIWSFEVETETETKNRSRDFNSPVDLWYVLNQSIN